MAKIDYIIETLKGICKQTGVRPSEDCLFENAIKIYISEQISESKRENIKSMKESDNKEFEDILNDRPTEKQLKFLMKNKIDIDPDLTRKEASKMIDYFIKNNLEKKQ